jgi:hypothetical protein
MYYEDLLDSAVNDESSVEFKLRQKEAADALKKMDRHYEKYSISFNDTWTDGKFYKRLTIENYGSGSHGTKIRNAVTGVRYNINVGSADEDLFFKVTDSTGRNGRKEPMMLYYDSPEQYENHHFTSVSPEVKQKWYKRHLEAQKRLEE